MIRKYTIYSTFILAFTALIRSTYADIPSNNPTHQNNAVIDKNVAENRPYIKLAGARWIVDEENDEQDQELNFHQALFPGNTANCKSVQSGIGKQVSYVQKCSACQDGYELNEEGVCAERKCEGYNNSETEIEGCESVDSCQKGRRLVYRCEECLIGYKLTDRNTCEVDKCENYPEEKKEDVKHCKAEPITCRKVEKVYYGCPEEKCDSGFKWKNGLCDLVTCNASFSLESCPKNGNCELCQSGNTKSYKLNSCLSGYMQSGNDCVRTSGALAFTMETTQNTQNIVLSVQGGCNIEWGDGAVEKRKAAENVSSDVTHTYNAPGSYDVRITGEPTHVSIKSGQEYMTKVIDTSLLTINDYSGILQNAKEKGQMLTPNMEMNRLP